MKPQISHRATLVLVFIGLLVAGSLGAQDDLVRLDVPAQQSFDLNHLELGSLAAVMPSDGLLQVYDPRNRRIVAITEKGLSRTSQALAGPALFVAEETGLFSVAYVKPSQGRPDADLLLVPGTLGRHDGRSAAKINTVDLSDTVLYKSAGSPAFRISAVLNFSVSGETLAAIGNLIADGHTQDELAFFTYSTRGKAPVTLRMAIDSRDAATYYRVYDYMASTRGSVFFLVLDGRQRLYRWSVDGEHVPKEIHLPDRIFGEHVTAISPWLPPRDMMNTVQGQHRLAAGLLAKDGQVFVVIRDPGEAGAAQWSLLRFTPESGAPDARLVPTALVKLPSRANHVLVVPSVDDGPWRLFEMAPFTEDYRQPVERMIELPSRTIEVGGRRVTK